MIKSKLKAQLLSTTSDLIETPEPEPQNEYWVTNPLLNGIPITPRDVFPDMDNFYGKRS